MANLLLQAKEIITYISTISKLLVKDVMLQLIFLQTISHLLQLIFHGILEALKQLGKLDKELLVLQ